MFFEQYVIQFPNKYLDTAYKFCESFDKTSELELHVKWCAFLCVAIRLYFRSRSLTNDKNEFIIFIGKMLLACVSHFLVFSDKQTATLTFSLANNTQNAFPFDLNLNSFPCESFVLCHEMETHPRIDAFSAAVAAAIISQMPHNQAAFMLSCNT